MQVYFPTRLKAALSGVVQRAAVGSGQRWHQTFWLKKNKWVRVSVRTYVCVCVARPSTDLFNPPLSLSLNF